MLSRVIEFFKSMSRVPVTEKQVGPHGLSYRMHKRQINQNSTQVHCFKPFVISLKNKTISKTLNKLEDLNDKVKHIQEHNKILQEIGKVLYLYFDPRFVYSFNNEINLVFFYNDNGNYIYDGNINKLLTSVASMASVLYSEKTNSKGFFTANVVEFDIDHEVLNYIVWRQYDCVRNTTCLLYKCAFKDKYLDGDLKLENTKSDSMKQLVFAKLNGDYNTSDLISVMYGITLKKKLYYKILETEMINDDEVAARYEIKGESVIFNESFKENLQKFVLNKHA